MAPDAPDAPDALSEAARLVEASLRAGKDAPAPPLAERRAQEAEMLALLPTAPGVTVGDVDAVGDSILATPDGAAGGAMVLYLHGGAYVTGTGRSRAAVASHLAAAMGVAVLSLDYRLAPEHPYPAAVDDALAGLDRCRELAGGGPVAVVGDSAGGGLTLAALVAARDRGNPTVRAAVLFSPWADLTLASRAAADNAEADAMLRADRLSESARSYAGSVPLDDPRVSPRFADLRGLPPLQVFVSGPPELAARRRPSASPTICGTPAWRWRAPGLAARSSTPGRWRPQPRCSESAAAAVAAAARFIARQLEAD